ncbi:MAG: glycosyltransferase [Clostridia bacterium]|nr:glycosyltransferase [Clostridia bacterium]
MKILQINSVYKTGSTGKIVSDLHNCYISKGYSSYVLYGRGKKIKEANVYKISSELEAKIHSFLSLLFGVDLAFSPLSTKNAIKMIKKVSPDIVHLHCLNAHYINAYRLINYLKKNKIKTIITIHAENMHTAGCEHAMDCNKWKTGCNHCPVIKGLISQVFRDDAKYCFEKMRQSIKGFDSLLVVGCSKWITNRCEESLIFKNHKCITIKNGIDVSSFSYIESSIIRERFNLDCNKKIILHVTPNFDHPIKGGRFIIELAKRMPDYNFVVVGSYAKINIPNLYFVGHIDSKEELANYYSNADCLAMTSYRENYPTVCLEASSCGLNIVGFNSGGIKETIPFDMGECVEPYDLDMFADALKKWANKGRKKVDYHVKRPFEMANDYLKAYEEILPNEFIKFYKKK